jgi:hypothetical protein
MSSVSRSFVLLLLLVSVVLWTGCSDGPPRTLPFPVLDPVAPFPELADRPAKAPAQEPRKASFTERLAGPSTSEGKRQEKSVRTVLLGNQLAGEIPVDPSWSWQNVEEGATLVDCRLEEDRPAALVYAEAFPARMRIAPSEEIQRFQLTVNPEGVEGRLTPSAVAGVLAGGLVSQVAERTGAGGPEAARILQLLATRTAGMGIGFHPATDSFTGWRWVGKNQQDVTVRLARFRGSWQPSPPLPAEIGKRLAALGKIPELAAAVERLGQRNPSSMEQGSGGASAYLLVGSATDDSEQAGVHLALLWQHSPDHRCVKGLSQLLASLRTKSGEKPELEGASDVQNATGIELLPSSAVVPLSSLRVARGAR